MALKIACAPEYFNRNRLEDNIERNSNRDQDEEVQIAFFELQEDKPRQRLARYDEKISENTFKDVHLKTLPGFLSHYTDPGTWYCKDQGTSKQPNLTEKISAGPQLVVKQEPIEIIDLEGSSNERRAFETKVERTSLVGSAYKEGLKQKILERRRAEGKQMIDLAKEEEIRQRQLELTQHLTKEDLERRRRKRLQNNLAAKRCRENRKQFHIRMEKEFNIQMSRRRQLLQAMEELKKEKGTIEDIWKACNRGVVTDETKRKIESLINTDFEKFVPEPLQVKPFSLVSEDSNEFDGEKSSITHDNENKVFCVEGHEVNEAMFLAQMFQVGSKRNNVVHSGESTESSASAEEDSVTGSEIMPTNSNSVNVPVFLDLTKDSKDLPNHVNSANRPNELYQASVSAGSMLLELAEATYSKMTAEEELVKQIRNTKAYMRESKHKQNLDDDDDDDDDDEDDFIPLVIDLAK